MPWKYCRARGFLAVLTVSALVASVVRAQEPQSKDTATYQGVVIRPGDIINLQGGKATVFNYWRYGHSALYLGVDPQTQQRTFLDFTTTKGEGVAKYIFGTAQPFFGRLLNEREFLTASLEAHEFFDVFRLKDSPPLDQKAMFREAKRISNTKLFGFSGEVCSSTVVKVLSKGSGIAIKGFTPESLTKGQFQRHPAGETISILGAIREVEESEVERKVVRPCKADIDAQFKAGEATIQGCEPCSAIEKQQQMEKLRYLRERGMKSCEIKGLETVIAYEMSRNVTGSEESTFLREKRGELKRKRVELEPGVKD